MARPPNQPKLTSRATPFCIACLAFACITTATLSAQSLARVANTTLAMPASPPTLGYAIADAFPGLTFSQPVGIVSPPGEINRLFVLEKGGRIQVITNVASPTKTLFMDLSGPVVETREDGLLGMAFHPGFRTNGYFFVFYTLSATTGSGTGLHDRLSRFSISPANPHQGLAASEVPLISQLDRYDTHNAGDLHFGADGYLYVSLGDEGGGGDQYSNSQRIDKNFFSAIMRLDVDQRPGSLAPNPHPASTANYAIPADNPFIGATTFNGLTVNPTAVRTEFWAVGLRNPWRVSFDRATGLLYCADVGQGEREEVNVITRGANYGWKFREGDTAYSGTPPADANLSNPVLSYRRTGTTSDSTREGNSVTGGLVYRGTKMPQLTGEYVFGDYSSGHIWAFRYDGATATNFRRLTGASQPVAFGADPANGDVLIAEIGSGRIRRLIYSTTSSGPALPPTLADTGAFSDLALLSPNPGIVPYDVNVNFWSDHAQKQRWFSVPNPALKIGFNPTSSWSFPTGTVWIKHMELELTNGVPESARRIETRLLVRNASGVYGITYRWGDSLTNAILVPEEGMSETFTIREGGTNRTQVWRYPARNECATCHTEISGWALGFDTPQLNRAHDYSGGPTENQIRALSDAGYFTAPVADLQTLPALAPAGDPIASLEHRVRSYLAANCAQCHQPAGSAQGFWDGRIVTATAAAGLIDGALVNYNGDSNNRVIKPGSLSHSMLLTRITTLGSQRMPPLGSSVVDTRAVALLSEWITGTSTTPPEIVGQPQSQSVTVDTTASFAVTATGSAPLQYQWRKETVGIDGATNSTLTLANVQTSQTGDYSVVITNSAGSITSAVAVLSVTPPATPPQITQQPQSQNVIAGALISFTVTATGSAPLQYQWRKDSVGIAGAINSTLMLADVQTSQAGDYAVVIANSAGSITSAVAVLAITLPATPPQISQQPQSQNVIAGAMVSFTVTVNGSTPMQYQWRKESVAITGATNSTLTLANVQATQAGNYSVVAANPYGSVTSSEAVLSLTSSLLVDHTVVDQYANIPQEYIDKVKRMWLNMPGGSRGKAYGIGAALLQGIDPRFRVGIDESDAPEGFTTDHLRISQVTFGNLLSSNRWRFGYGANAWFTSALALETTKRHIMYCNTNNLEIGAIGFDWGGDMIGYLAGGIDPAFGTRWGGTSDGGPDGNRSWGLDSGDFALTGNRISVDTYLAVTQAYADFCESNGFPTKVFFTTGPVESSLNVKESGYQRHLKHEYIRSQVAASAKGILFDYADILCWNDAGELATTTWSGNGTPRTIPVVHPDNLLDLESSYVDDGDRIGKRGALRLAKAMWWMLARMSGWDPAASTSPPALLASLPVGEPGEAFLIPMARARIIDGQFHFTVVTQPDSHYVIEFKDTLNAPQWMIFKAFAGRNSPSVIVDQESAGGSRFYRVRIDRR